MVLKNFSQCPQPLLSYAGLKSECEKASQQKILFNKKFKCQGNFVEELTVELKASLTLAMPNQCCLAMLKTPNPDNSSIQCYMYKLKHCREYFTNNKVRGTQPRW